MPIRRASHAGSWYTDSGPDLSKQLDEWLSQAELVHGPARAIIAPHAGYQYCGACGGHAYRQVSAAVVTPLFKLTKDVSFERNRQGKAKVPFHLANEKTVIFVTALRVFILGPSHHVRLSSCALSSAHKYNTPLYELHIDRQVYSELDATGQFEWMDMRTDENEHSIEMHLPYIAKVMEDYRGQFTIVPILVGSLSPEREAAYGRLLSQYLADPRNLFVISSDFCHWGQRFRYTYYDKTFDNISQSIEFLDRAGMDIIENLNPSAFTEYLKKYGNTICGRHPIGILLQAVQALLRSSSNRSANLKFLKYAQSSQCQSMYDSSVSYASAALVID